MSRPLSQPAPASPDFTDGLVPLAAPAHPVEVSSVPVARPVGFPTIAPGHCGETYITTTQPITDRLAVASAVCGLSGFIPVVSQLAAIVLGFMSLGRIKRARRQGVQVPGRGWAMTGIVGGVVSLSGWIAMGGFLTLVGSSLSQSSETLNLLNSLSQQSL